MKFGRFRYVYDIESVPITVITGVARFTKIFEGKVEQRRFAALYPFQTLKLCNLLIYRALVLFRKRRDIYAG